MKDKLIFKTNNLRVSFAWYDLWIGIFIDTDKGKIYVCPIPTILITIKYK